LSAFLVEIPYIAVISLLFVSISYWIVGLKDSVGAFFFFYLGALILACFFMATSVAYAALLPSLPIAQVSV
jgi:ABC-type multidrug transport system permease subunit